MKFKTFTTPFSKQHDRDLNAIRTRDSDFFIFTFQELSVPDNISNDSGAAVYWRRPYRIVD